MEKLTRFELAELLALTEGEIERVRWEQSMNRQIGEKAYLNAEPVKEYIKSKEKLMSKLRLMLQELS